jgi:hypothetical protein
LIILQLYDQFQNVTDNKSIRNKQVEKRKSLMGSVRAEKSQLGVQAARSVLENHISHQVEREQHGCFYQVRNTVSGPACPTGCWRLDISTGTAVTETS